MDFIEQLQIIATKVRKQGEYLSNEEATKGALVMPFIQALGYDVFNPEEVAREYTVVYLLHFYGFQYSSVLSNA